VKAWREADHGGLAEREYNFHRRQYRRRMQASGMLGIIGLLILGHLWIHDNTVLAIYWSGVIVLVFWSVLLALGDWASSRLHYGPLVADQQAEHLLLKREIEKFRRESQPDKHQEPEGNP
jgi:hypothetical protein